MSIAATETSPIILNMMSDELAEFIDEQSTQMQTLIQKVEVLMAHVKQTRDQLDDLSEQVEKKFMEESFFECPGHHKLLAHFDSEKKAHKKANKEVEKLRGNKEFKDITYRLAEKNCEEDSIYFQDVNPIKKWIKYNFAAVITTYHHDNSIACPAYQEWLRNKELKSFRV